MMRRESAVRDQRLFDMASAAGLLGALSLAAVAAGWFVASRWGVAVRSTGETPYGLYLTAGLVGLAGFVSSAAAVLTGLTAWARLRVGWEYRRIQVVLGVAGGGISLLPCLVFAAIGLFGFSFRFTF